MCYKHIVGELKKGLQAITYILPLLVFLYVPTSVMAQRGCCSWHGGVGYCDSRVGSLVCNDGTYSPSCGCYRAPQVVQPPDFPANMNATISYQPDETGTYSVIVTLSDPDPTSYSAVLGQVIGADPGPLTDFTGGVLTFNKIAPGSYYLNVKKSIDGVWSKVVYWTITVPAWVAPTPTPTPTPLPSPLVLGTSTEDTTTDLTGLVVILLVGGVIGSAIWLANRQNRPV